MKIKLLLAALLVSVSAFAGTFQSEANLSSSTNKTILAAPAVLHSITLWSTNTSATIVKLYDNYRVYTNTAWTNFTTTISSTVEEVVTSTGTTNYYTNSVITRTANPTAAAENVEPPILRTIVVPASADGVASGSMITVTGPIYFNRRITADISATGLSYVMDYTSP